MIRVLVEQRTVYRSEIGGRGRLTRRAAYLDAAWQAWRAKYPCECEFGVGYVCGEHVGCPGCHFGETVCHTDCRVKHRKRVIDRLYRWLLWRDGRGR